MNRAAERAVPAGKAIFWDAITAMSIDDARQILGGGPTAATEYFQTKTTVRLTTAFRPIVAQAMNEVGVTRQYQDLVGRFQAIPFAKSATFDLDGYVVSKALAGLFYMVGEEEKKMETWRCREGKAIALLGPLLLSDLGAGTSRLARGHTTLPEMSVAEAIKTTRIHRVAGLTGDRTAWVATRPCRAPHHTISDVVLIGGGHVPMPGDVSLAHHGVLLLDMAEFRRMCLRPANRSRRGSDIYNFASVIDLTVLTASAARVVTRMGSHETR